MGYGIPVINNEKLAEAKIYSKPPFRNPDILRIHKQTKTPVFVIYMDIHLISSTVYWKVSQEALYSARELGARAG